MATQTVTDADFEQAVLKASTPVVVDFWAEWCQPCKKIAPILEEISETVGDKVKIVKLDVESSQQTASTYGIRSIPTLIMFKNGQPVDMKIGLVAKAELDKWISGAA